MQKPVIQQLALWPAVIWAPIGAKFAKSPLATRSATD
jgi:hypothetical protein